MWPGYRSATRTWWRWAGITAARWQTCRPFDPESKGGTEATVKIAKADLVPAEANLREEYASFARAGGGLRRSGASG